MITNRVLGVVVRAQPFFYSQKRGIAQVINLSRSEIRSENKDDEEPQKRPAKSHILTSPFKKLDFKNTILSQTLLKVKSKKMREKHGLILLEGTRLIQEAIDAGCKVESIFFSQTSVLKELNLPEHQIRLYKTPYNDMKLWSSLTTPPGIMGIFKKPSPIPETKESLPLTIICDQLSEPGNLGSMIRNCAGAGVRRVILTSGCTDLWDEKVLRGGAGAHFKVRVRTGVDWPEVEQLVLAENSRLLLAALPTDTFSEAGEPLATSPYWSIDYREKHNFIVVGGETKGLSKSAREIAAKTNGEIISIPLANSLDSLNSVSAASVIMFEVKRQLAFKEAN